MLHCIIALAASGEDSQLMGWKMAWITNLCVRRPAKHLKLLNFHNWHGSCSAVHTNVGQWSEQMEAQVNQVALPLRSHTILGICEAIGEDFGFNPVLLRVPLAAMVIWSPMIAIGSYFGLGIAVLASRLIFPKARSVSVQSGDAQVAANEQRELAKAA